MKRKELKNLAQKIAKQERIVQTSDNPTEVQRAQNEIMKLCGCVESIEDITIIDEMVAELLTK